MLLTPDMKLIHAIFQVGGPEGYFTARSEGVRAEILFDEARDIWRLMEKMIAKGRLPSLTEIQLQTSHQIDEVCPDPLDVSLCAQILVKRGLSGQLHEKLGEITGSDAINVDPFKVRDQLSDLIVETAWSFGQPYSLNSRSSIEELLASYERAEGRGSALLGLPSPWTTIDAASLGLQPGELTVLFAKRKVGKSFLTIKWAVHIWQNHLKVGDKLLFVTMEMTPLQVLKRMACMVLRFSWSDFRAGRLTSAEKQKLEDWVEARINAHPDDANIIIVGANQVRTVKDLAAVTGEYRPVGVFVDSFYILGRASGRTLHERVLTNVQELKLDIALQFEVPVFASTQLKGTTDKDVLMADSDDAMGAKAIGDYADATIGLFVDTELRAANQRLLRGMEAREFQPKGIKMNFDLDSMDFSEIEELPADFGRAKVKTGKKGGAKGATTPPHPPKPSKAPDTDDDDDDELLV